MSYLVQHQAAALSAIFLDLHKQSCALVLQVAGFVQDYEGLSYATVKGAGHMVGQAKPEEALNLIDRFLRNKSL